MQHVTSSGKVEGQDIVDSIHPAPSSDHLRKEGCNTYIGIHTNLYRAKNCEYKSEALKNALRK